jgi:hypothetical protein
MRRSTFIAARLAALRVLSQPEFTQSALNAKKNMRRSTFMRPGCGAARVQPSLNPRSRPSNAKKKWTSQHSAADRGAADAASLESTQSALNAK